MMMIKKSIELYKLKMVHVFNAGIMMSHLCLTELNYLKEELDDELSSRHQLNKAVMKEFNKLRAKVDRNMNSVTIRYGNLMKNREDFTSGMWEQFDEKIREAFNLERVTKICWKRHVLAMCSLQEEILVTLALVDGSQIDISKLTDVRLYLGSLRGLSNSLKQYLDFVIPLTGIEDNFDFNDRTFFLSILTWISNGEYDIPMGSAYSLEGLTEHASDSIKNASVRRFAKR